MKLSEFKGERAIEVIADLIEPIANIGADPKCADLFKGDIKKGESPRDAGIRNLKAKVPYLLKTHKKSVIAILAILSDAPAESMNLFTIAKGVVEIFNDKELIELFTSAAASVDDMPQADTSKK